MECLSFAERLLEWYDRSARTLPWRGTRDPYRIHLSEIMLQQTRVETVRAYYERFLNACPDVFALAGADPDTVNKLWEGLGYYSRARNLAAAAREIVRAYNGVYPRTSAELRKLPGIGPYAANAIASIAYGEPVPALDGNQMRILSRCLAVERVLKTPFDLEGPALSLLSRDRPGDYNQALMDLGSGVCTSSSPRCGICPLAEICLAHARGTETRYPLKPAPAEKSTEAWTVVLLMTPDGILIHQRKETALLKGLYEFVMIPGHAAPEKLPGILKDMGFAKPRNAVPLPGARHVFSHKIWEMRGVLMQCAGGPPSYIPVRAEGILRHAFPSAFRIYREIALDLLGRNRSFLPAP